MHGFKGTLAVSIPPPRTRIVTHPLQPKAAPSTSAATSSQPPSTPAPAAAQTPAAPPAPAPASSTAAGAPATPSPAPAAAEAGGEQGAVNDPSTLLMGTQSEAVIGQMEAMGFARADIDRAMRAAYFNPDRAIEYLLSVSFLSPVFWRPCFNPV